MINNDKKHSTLNKEAEKKVAGNPQIKLLMFNPNHHRSFNELVAAAGTVKENGFVLKFPLAWFVLYCLPHWQCSSSESVACQDFIMTCCSLLTFGTFTCCGFHFVYCVDLLAKLKLEVQHVRQLRPSAEFDTP